MGAWEEKRNMAELGRARTSDDVDIIIWGIFRGFVVFVG